MPRLVSKVKRKRGEAFTLEGEKKKVQSEEELLRKAEEVWESTTTMKELAPESLPKLSLDSELDEEADEAEEESAEIEEKERLKEKEVREADVQPVFGGDTLSFQFQELSYEDSNGRADSFLWHDRWWQSSAQLEELVIHNPQRIPNRGDTQYETMVRVAMSAPAGLRKNNPGRMKKETGRKVEQNKVEMIQIAHAAGQRVRSKLAEAVRFGKPKFDRNSIKLIRAGAAIHKRARLEEIQSYHEPQLTRAQTRSFVQSLDKLLTPLQQPVPAFTQDTALERLLQYAQDMSELSYLSLYVISPKIPDKRVWEDLLLREGNREQEAELFVDLDSTQDKAWQRVVSQLRSDSVPREQVWETVVLTSALTGSIPWTGQGWELRDSELLLTTLELLSTVLRKYDDVAGSISLRLEDDIDAGELDRKKRDKELERRLAARIRPFVISVRKDPYGFKEDLATEVMLNAFYGVERDEQGAVSQMTVEADDGTVDWQRLLPLFNVPADVVTDAAMTGRLVFDIDSYTAGSYSYPDRIIVSKQIADALDSAGLDRKVSEFRSALIEALQNYRQATMRVGFLQDLELPHLTGLDPNTLLCEVASYINRASDPKLSILLREAVRAMPRLTSAQSRRSKAMSQYLLYYALAMKLSLFEDGYLRPIKAEAGQRKRRDRRTISEFIDVEAEEDDGEKGAATTTESRLLRVAAALYNPNNVLSEFDRQDNDVIDAGWFLKWALYSYGVRTIKEDTQDQIAEYQEVWLNFPVNRDQIASGKWPLQFIDADGESRDVTLSASRAIDSIPYVRDLHKSAELTISSLRDSFYSAVSVREIMQKGRAILPAAPKAVSKSFPLVLPRDRDTNVKQRALQVALLFLTSGYLLPSNFDSLAAGLTMIQLARVLDSNSSSALDIPSIFSTLLQPDSIKLPKRSDLIPCALLGSAMFGRRKRFIQLLHAASIQDIRLAAVLALQIDYWRPPFQSKNVVDDIKTSIVHGLVRHLLDNDEAAIQRYNAALEATNKVIRSKGHTPEILSGLNAEGYMDYLIEADYDSLTLDNLLEQIGDKQEPVVIYTPWMSIQKALRLYLNSVQPATLSSLCFFVNDSAGELLRQHYVRTDCGAAVIIDVQQDDIIRPETFRMMQAHSLVYHGEDYDSRVEAVIAYFNITTETLSMLNKLNEPLKSKLGSSQKKLWDRLATSSDSIGDILESLTKTQRKQLASSVEIMTDSSLQELSMESDDRMYQSRVVRGRSYTGYIFRHDKTAEDGSVSTVYTPVYPGYERQVKRLLNAVSTAQQKGQHWLDVWKYQYRASVFSRMRLQEGVWVPTGRSKEFSLNMEQLVNRGKHLDEFDIIIKGGLQQPPIQPAADSDAQFTGFVPGDERSGKQAPIFLLFSHILRIPAGLGALPFLVPDSVTGRTLDIGMAVEGIDFLVDINLVDRIAPQGMPAYLASHSPEQALGDVTGSVNNLIQLFTDAMADIQAGSLSTDSVQNASVLFDTTPDKNLENDLEIGLKDVARAQELVEALRYATEHPGEILSQVGTHIASKIEPVPGTEQTYSAPFLQSIKIPIKRRKRTVSTDVTTPMEIVLPAELEPELVTVSVETPDKELSAIEELIAIAAAEEEAEELQSGFMF